MDSKSIVNSKDLESMELDSITNSMEFKLSINSASSPGADEYKPISSDQVNQRPSTSRSSRWDDVSQENFEDFFYNVLKFNKKNLLDNFRGITEMQMDLFDISRCYSLAHCVAADLRMSQGIAVEFRTRFGRVGDLIEQKQGKGGLAFLRVDEQFVYYLVTKDYSHGKPTMRILFESLLKMRNHMIANNITRLGIPRIGCGLDRLNWLEVKLMLEYVFRRTDIEIVVCSF